MTNVIAKRSFDADADLLRVVEKAIEGLRQGSPKALLNAQGKPAIVKIGGTGVAGPVFMDNAEYRKFVYKTWQADSLDMESTAVAHVCWSNNVPFVIIRALSDLAGGQEGENDFSEFAKNAEKNAAQVMAALLQHL
jgi:adenosylhomocysteine nucleosidase